MSQPVAFEPVTPSDAELIAAVRGGDNQAYGVLFERHRDAALRLARQLTGPSEADDLVSDAFAKVLTVLQRGGGPDVAFRAYLLTAVRRLHVDRVRASKHLVQTGEMEQFDPGVPFRDPALAEFENSAAAKAFASLPERWQLVLWHLEVEGQKPAEIGPLLGLSANSVSALAYRAREGLRQAYVQMHLADTGDEECRWVSERLGAYVRKGLSKRDAAKVDEHLDRCPRCAAAYLELADVNSNLSAIIAPLLLGTAAAGYLASTGTSAAGAGLLLFKARHLAKAHGVAAGGSAAAAATAVAVSLAVILSGGGNHPDRIASDLPSGVHGPSLPGSSTGPTDGPGGTSGEPSPQSTSGPTTTSARAQTPGKTILPGTQPGRPTEPIPTSPTSPTAPGQPPHKTQGAPGQRPVVRLDLTSNSGPAPLTVTVDASRSTDPQGGHLSYFFDFGDPSGGGGLQPGRFAGLAPDLVAGRSSTATHVYRNPGVYTLSVMVMDPQGNSTTITRTITVTAPSAKAPTARLTVKPHHGTAPLTVTANGGASSDPQGDALSYAFAFGDGTTVGPGAADTASHVYSKGGTYTVSLTVTDGSGLSDTTTRTVIVAPAPQPPTARLSVTPSSGQAPLKVVADAGGSSDPQGQRLSYAFDFGDGSGQVTSHKSTRAHTYSFAGTFTVTVTVTDRAGLSDTMTQSVTVSPQSSQVDLVMTGHARPLGRSGKVRFTIGVITAPPASQLSFEFTASPTTSVKVKSRDWTCTQQSDGSFLCTADSATPSLLCIKVRYEKHSTPSFWAGNLKAVDNADPDLTNNSFSWP